CWACRSRPGTGSLGARKLAALPTGERCRSPKPCPAPELGSLRRDLETISSPDPHAASPRVVIASVCMLPYTSACYAITWASGKTAGGPSRRRGEPKDGGGAAG